MLKTNILSDSIEGLGIGMSNIKTSDSNVKQVIKWKRSISLDYGADLRNQMKQYEILLNTTNFPTNFSSPLNEKKVRDFEEINEGIMDKAGIKWESTSITGNL